MNFIKMFSVVVAFLVCGCATTPTEDLVIQCIKGPLAVYSQHTVEAADSYRGVVGPVWVWESVFENSGTLSATITHREVKVQAPDGSVWETTDPVTKKPVGRVKIDIKVGPGKSKSFTYWCYDTSHTMCNGICSLVFYAVDEKGNKFVLPSMVFLSHKNCPKKVK
ncbi:MAG: hypothetical protein V1645_01340 [archaeon]